MTLCYQKIKTAKKLENPIEVALPLFAANKFNFEISNNCEPKGSSTIGFWKLDFKRNTLLNLRFNY